MKPPRILHVSTAADWRGGEQQLAYLIEELNDGRADQLVCCVQGGAISTFCAELSVPHVTKKRGAGVDISLGRLIAKHAKSFEADLIHTHDGHGHTAAILAASLFGMRAPIVVSRRVDFHVHSRLSKAFKYKHGAVARIVCVSKRIEDIMAEDLGSRGKLCTVHSGIDPARFVQVSRGKLHALLGLPAETKLVGNVAAHAPHKDLFTFLRTAKRLSTQFPELQFVSIGSGALTDELIATARELGVHEHMHFTGFRKDVPELLPDLNVFLMTSSTEGLGTSILDAFAAGVPVVATRAGGIPEMVIHGSTGYLAAVGDDASLASEVAQVLELGDRGTVAGATAKLDQFTKSAMASNMLKVYWSVLAQA